jgi:PAS domain S-box-containing protein
MNDPRVAPDPCLFEPGGDFGQILDALADMVLVRGEDSRILWANRAFREYTGTSNADLRDRLHAPASDQDLGAEAARARQHLLGSGEVLDIAEEPLTRHDGVVQIFHTLESPVTEPGGKVRMTVGVARNITGQRRMQDELDRYRQHLEKLVGDRTSQIRALSDRLQLVLSSLAEGIVALDGAGQVRLLNPAAENLTGWSTDDAKGQELGGLLDFEPEAPGVSLRGILGGGRPGSGRLRARGGSTFLVSLKGSPLVGPSGELVGSVVVIRDIGAERALEEQRLSNQKLESVGLLAGGIAHDFNNIVTGILGSISLARMGLERGEDITGLLDEAQQACLRTKGLTTQLLTFAKGGAPLKKILHVERVVRESAEFALRGSLVELVVRRLAEAWPVEADEGQLAQVVSNLVLNAKQAMPGGGTIWISLDNLHLGEDPTLPLPAGPYLAIAVEDSGPGIPPEHLSRVFDPYFTTRAAGTGLGLASVHSIVRRHGGHVSVSSDPGAGACFRLYLPAQPNELAAGVAAPAAAMARRPRKLLVVDDDPGVLTVMRSMLHHLGHDVSLAERSSAALSAFERARTAGAPFEAVFADLTMPGDLGGLELAAWLREKAPDVRIVVMSGYSVDPVMADPAARGFAGALPKPFTVETLSRAVESCFEPSASQLPR